MSLVSTSWLNENHSKELSILIGIVAGLCGSMLAGIFENNFFDSEVQITILFCFGLALALIKKVKSSI